MGTQTSEITKFVANKTFTMYTVEYKPGDPVDTSKLLDHKVKQLLRQRYLRPAVE